jgi:hypothetical protein
MERLEAQRPTLADHPAYRGPARAPLPTAAEYEVLARRGAIVQVSLWIPRARAHETAANHDARALVARRSPRSRRAAVRRRARSPGRRSGDAEPHPSRRR